MSLSLFAKIAMELRRMADNLGKHSQFRMLKESYMKFREGES